MRPAIFKDALRFLFRAKVKTFLMMLGPAVGIAALVMVVAMGEGTKKKLMKRVNNIGTYALMVIAGDSKLPPDMGVKTMTLADAKALDSHLINASLIAPGLMMGGKEMGREGKYTRSALFGVTEAWSEAWRWPVIKGEFITSDDVQGVKRVAVIGLTVAKELFGKENPVGKSIRIGRVTLQVKGLMKKRGTCAMGSDMDNRVFIPLTTARKRLSHAQHINMIRVVVNKRFHMKKVAKEIRSFLRKRHRIKPQDLDDFGVVTPSHLMKTSKKVSSVLTKLLLAIAIIALLGGGLVVMMIMLTSISSRRGEIGLRRAMGATQNDILWHFVFESILATFFGGLGGILLGLVGMWALKHFGGATLALSWLPFALSFGISMVLGLVAGLYPSMKAAAVPPVEALIHST